jgi:hypothetical protein
MDYDKKAQKYKKPRHLNCGGVYYYNILNCLLITSWGAYPVHGTAETYIIGSFSFV